MVATKVALPGKFEFSINQSGLDFNNKVERETAIRDFWREWELFCEKLRNIDYIDIDYDEDDLIVEEGDY